MANVDFKTITPSGYDDFTSGDVFAVGSSGANTWIALPLKDFLAAALRVSNILSATGSQLFLYPHRTTGNVSVQNKFYITEEDISNPEHGYLFQEGGNFGIYAPYGDLNLSGSNKVHLNDNTLISNDIRATVSGDVDSFNPGANNRYIYLNCNGNHDITGLSYSARANEEHAIINNGTGTLTFKHNSTGTTSGRRFFCAGGADIALSSNYRVALIYDTGINYWRVF